MNPTTSTPVPTRNPTQRPSAHPTTTVAGTVGPWGMCGGCFYDGPTTCTAGFTCTPITFFFSQCRPISSRHSADSSLTYEINAVIENVQASELSEASQAALMNAIRSIQFNAGHEIDTLDIRSSSIQASSSSLRASVSSSSLSNKFDIVLSMTLILEGDDKVKTIYADSTSALTTAMKNGQLQAQLRENADRFEASESSQATIASLSYSSYRYNAPASSGSKSNNEEGQSNPLTMLSVILPVAIGFFLFAIISYFILRCYRQQQEKNRLSKQAHFHEIFHQSEKYLSEHISQDYSVSTQEHQSMEFISNNFIHRHGSSYEAENASNTIKNDDNSIIIVLPVANSASISTSEVLLNAV
jgi:hypothetical protein